MRGRSASCSRRFRRRDQATGACYLELRSAAQQMKWTGTGYYDDEYEKVGDRWKFKARRFKMVHSAA